MFVQVLGHDIGRIRGIINSVWADTAPEKRPILVGPDTAVDVSWDSAFLEVRHGSCVCYAWRKLNIVCTICPWFHYLG